MCDTLGNYCDFNTPVDLCSVFIDPGRYNDSTDIYINGKLLRSIRSDNMFDLSEKIISVLQNSVPFPGSIGVDVQGYGLGLYDDLLRRGIHVKPIINLNGVWKRCRI